MAHTTSITSSNPGKPSEFIIKALFGGRALSTKGIDIDPDVKYKKIFRSHDMASLVQTGTSCTFNANGSTTVAESTFEVKDHYVDILYCFKDFKTSWNYSDPHNIPDDVLEAAEKRVKGDIQADIESKAFRGLSQSSFTGGTFYNSAQFNGYLKQLKAGSPLTQTGVTLTSANIVAELAKVVAKLPNALKVKPREEVVIFCSMNAADLYESNLAAQGINTTADGYETTYKKYEVRGVDLPDNVMIAGLRDNFKVISNAGLEDVKYNVVNMYPVNLDMSLRIHADYAYNVAVTNIAQTVLYGTVPTI